MNPLNYGSLEACQSLVEKGIVLETEAVWYSVYGNNKKFLVSDVEYQRIADKHSRDVFTSIPAPSLAEVLRELKELSFSIRLQKNGTFLIWLEDDTYEEINKNSTDTLIELLIWVRERKEKE